VVTIGKLKSLAELVTVRGELQSAGARLVLTNGCFDLLHVGHVRYLQAARALGNALVVAVNGDRSVCALKGPGRPINNENDRAEVLAALGSVDFVTIFHVERITELVQAIRPDIYVKGGDYTIDTLNREEVGALRAIGAEIRILPLIAGKSTTSMIQKMQSAEQAGEKKEQEKTRR